MRVVEVLKLEAGMVEFIRTPSRDQRLRLLALWRLQAGLPAYDPAPRRPAGKGTPIDVSFLVREQARVEARRKARRRTLNALGLHEDAQGRTVCVLCGEAVSTAFTGLRGASPWAEGLWHRTLCAARAT